MGDNMTEKIWVMVGARVHVSLRRRLGVWMDTRLIEPNVSQALIAALELMLAGIEDPGPDYKSTKPAQGDTA